MKTTIQHTEVRNEFYTLNELFTSLFPSVKVELLNVLLLTSSMVTIAEQLLGVDSVAILALLVMMVFELATGIWASSIRKEQFSSKRLSRFAIKVACYMVIMVVPYVFYSSYQERGVNSAAMVFEWIHVFLVIHIVQEYLVSILENLACIQGKPKTYWINKIKDSITNTFKTKS
jgi:phage-related holin